MVCANYRIIYSHLFVLNLIIYRAIKYLQSEDWIIIGLRYFEFTVFITSIINSEKYRCTIYTLTLGSWLHKLPCLSVGKIATSKELPRCWHTSFSKCLYPSGCSWLIIFSNSSLCLCLTVLLWLWPWLGTRVKTIFGFSALEQIHPLVYASYFCFDHGHD